jgi:phosphoglycerate kinase
MASPSAPSSMAPPTTALPPSPPATLPGFRTIDELPLARQRVLIRVDFDVELDAAGNLGNDRKLLSALPTIRKALDEGARVVLATHLGGEKEPPQSLEPVAAKLAELLRQEVFLPDECVGDAARKVVSDLREGQVCLLENLRYAPEEARNDETFARKLAALCDVYVGEAFACSHLSAASIVALPRLVQDRGVGYRLRAELEALSPSGRVRERPCIGYLGGGSLTSKLDVLELMLKRCEAVCLGGAVANTLLAAKSLDLKTSVVEREQLALARNLLTRARDQKVELLLPVDVLVGTNGDALEGRAVSVGSIPDGSGAFDIGPRTLEAFTARLAGAKTAIVNGALGMLENPAFASGTTGLLRALAQAPTFGVVSGGSAARAAYGAEITESELGFISTGDVASLVLIEGKKLPGVDALRG